LMMVGFSLMVIGALIELNGRRRRA
jgi:hypothetical protein